MARYDSTRGYIVNRRAAINETIADELEARADYSRNMLWLGRLQTLCNAIETAAKLTDWVEDFQRRHMVG